MIPWKLCWVTLGGVVTLTAGIVPALFAVSAYAVIPGVALAGATVGMIALKFVSMSDVFRPLPPDDRVFVCRCIAAAVFLHAAWIAALALSPSWLLWWPIGVVVLAVAEWVWCEAHEYLLNHRPEKPEKPTTSEGRPLDRPELDMAEALERAGHRRVTVQGWEPVVDESGVPFGATFRVQLPITRGGGVSK